MPLDDPNAVTDKCLQIIASCMAPFLRMTIFTCIVSVLIRSTQLTYLTCLYSSMTRDGSTFFLPKILLIELKAALPQVGPAGRILFRTRCLRYLQCLVTLRPLIASSQEAEGRKMMGMVQPTTSDPHLEELCLVFIHQSEGSIGDNIQFSRVLDTKRADFG